MPVVEVDPDELRDLTGHDEKSDADLREDLFALGMEYEGATDDGAFELEFAPDRLDRLSVEGVARSLRYQYGDARGAHIPSATSPDWRIVADPPAGRPCVTGAILRGVELDDDGLASLIQLQEKLHATIGRERAKGAIGIHDLTMMKGLDDDALPAAAREADASTPTADPSTDRGRTPVDADDDGPTPANAVRYTGIAPDAKRFVPLEADAEMTPADVLTDHDTGREYADLVTDLDRYPAILDGVGLFSFPPVINGRRTEVTPEVRDLFVECTGTDQWTIDRMCTIVCYALVARGATIERVRVDYLDGVGAVDGTDDAGDDESVSADGSPAGDTAVRTLDRPDLEPDTKRVTHERIERTLGIDLRTDQVVDLLERSGLDGAMVETSEDEIAYDATIPPYRVDVLHPRDVVDDIGRAYGFNDLEPRYPDVSTVGGRHHPSRHERAVREALVGCGFEDLLNFHLIAEDETFDRMGLVEGGLAPTDDGVAAGETPLTDGSALGATPPVRIREPYSADYEIVRTWALPSLLMVLEGNTHRRYPQHLAEVGLAARVDPDAGPTGVAERRTVAAALADAGAGYEDAKARLAHLADAFGCELATPPTDHPSFIDGRTAAVRLDGTEAGVIGEVHPAVLVEHDLEVPVAAFEFDLDALDTADRDAD